MRCGYKLIAQNQLNILLPLLKTMMMMMTITRSKARRHTPSPKAKFNIKKPFQPFKTCLKTLSKTPFTRKTTNTHKPFETKTQIPFTFYGHAGT